MVVRGGLDWSIDIDVKGIKDAETFRALLRDIKNDLSSIKTKSVSVRAQGQSERRRRTTTAQEEVKKQKALDKKRLEANRQLKEKLENLERDRLRSEGILRSKHEKELDQLQKNRLRKIQAANAQQKEVADNLRKEELAAQRQQQEALKARTKALTKYYKEQQRLIERNRKEQQKVAANALRLQLREEAAAERAAERARRRLPLNVVDQQKKELGRQIAINKIQQADPEFQRLKQQLDAVKGTDKRDSGSLVRQFSRLVKVVIVLQGIRLAFDAVGASVRGVVQQFSELETATVGIAGVLTSAGRVRDQAGQQVKGVEAFNAALGISEGLINQIRVDSLSTVATFDELARTVQVALGPGLSAGLEVDEVREFSLRISQAAAAFGVSQRELSEEVRSILTARVRPGQSRIADVLQISNEDIRNAQQTGRFAEYLRERFESLDIAGKAAARTLPGAIQRLRDALLQTGAVGASSVLDQVKNTILDLQELLISRDRNGLIIFNPDAVQVARSVAGLLADIGRFFADSLRGFGIDGLAASLELLRSGLQSIFAVLQPLFSGFAQGLSASLQFLRGIQRVISAVFTKFIPLGGIAETLSEGLGAALGFVAPLLGGVLAISSGVAALNALLATQIVASLTRILGLSKGIVLALGKVVLIPALVAAGLDQLVARSQAVRKGLINALEFLTGEDIPENVERYLSGITEGLKPFQQGLKIAGEEVGTYVDSLLNIKDVSEDGADATDALGFSISGNLNKFQEFSIEARDLANEIKALNRESSILNRTGGQTEGGLSKQLQTALDSAGKLDSALQRVDDEIALRSLQKASIDLTGLDGGDLETARAKIAQLNDEIAELAAIRQKSEKNIGALLDEQISQQSIINALADQRAAKALAIEASVTEAINSTNLDSGLTNAQKEQRIQAAELRAEYQEIVQKKADLVRLQNTEAVQFDTILTYLERYQVSSTAVQKLEAARNASLARSNEEMRLINAEALKLQRTIAELQVQETFGAGAFAGAQANILTDRQAGEQLVSTFSQSVSSQIQAGVAAAFTPGQNPDLQQGIAAIASELGTKILTNILEQAILNPLLEAIPNPADAADNAGLNLAASQLQSASLQLLTAGPALQGPASTLLAAATLLSSAGALGITPIPGRAKGGFAPGFAEGGSPVVPRPAAGTSAPAGLDRRDKVMAYLRQGEFVSTPPLVRALAGLGLGPQLLHAYNHGRIGARALQAAVVDALGRTPNFSSPRSSLGRGRVSPLQGFAEGGAVGALREAALGVGARSGQTEPTGGGRQRAGSQPSLSVLATRPSVDEIISIIRSNPGAFRSALGL